MTSTSPTAHPNPVRVALWSLAGALLLLPLIAMQFTDEVVWTAGDFVFAGVLIGGTGLAFELLARMSRQPGYRAGVAVALAAAFLMVWINAAVGLIGDTDTPANTMYAGVLLIGLAGALVARFRPLGMARALAVTALAQAVVGAVAAIGDLGASVNSPLQMVMLNGFFVALFAISAALFRHAAQSAPANTSPTV